jgi:hypothetical protein
MASCEFEDGGDVGLACIGVGAGMGMQPRQFGAVEIGSRASRSAPSRCPGGRGPLGLADADQNPREDASWKVM